MLDAQFKSFEFDLIIDSLNVLSRNWKISIDNVKRQAEDEEVNRFNQSFGKLMETLAQRSPRQ